MVRNFDVMVFTSKYLYFKEAFLANFPDIIKIAIMIKITFKGSMKVRTNSTVSYLHEKNP